MKRLLSVLSALALPTLSLLGAQTCPVTVTQAGVPQSGENLGRSVAAGTTLTIVGSDARTYVFDTASGTQLHVWNYPAEGLAFDGEHALAAGPGGMVLFDPLTGVPVPGFSPAFQSTVIDMGDNRILVGDPTNECAYVLDKLTGSLFHTLRPDDPSPTHEFGSAVGISDTVAVVGAPEWLGSSPAEGGAAYVFDVQTGDQIRRVIGISAQPGERFGAAVSASSTHVAVGAPDFSIAFDGTITGTAYVYDSAGIFLHRFVAFDTGADDRFGADVELDGDKLIVGAPGHDYGGAPGRDGAAYLFDAPTGTQIAKLAMPAGMGVDDMGTSVSLHGDHALAGGPTSDPPGANNAGLFSLHDAGLLLQQATVTEYNGSGINQDYLTSTPARFGYFISGFLTPRADRAPGTWIILVRTASTSGAILDLGNFLGLQPAGPSELLVTGNFLNNHGPVTHDGGGTLNPWAVIVPNLCALLGQPWRAQAVVFGDLPGTPGVLDPHFSSAVGGTVGAY